jgi:hypothetical protein
METSDNLPEPNLNPLTSSAEGSPARISARPESEPELRVLARAFGLSSPVLLGSFDPDTYLLRTSQACLFLEQCPEWSESWPDSGMWDSGGVYELQTSAPVTSESACSLWPTTRSSSGGGNKSAYEGAPYRPALAQRTQTWPTARQEDVESCGNHPGAVDSLTGAAKLWNTPRAITGGAETAERKQELGRTESGGGDLQAQTQLWQTPATDSFRSRGGDRKDEMGLDQQARMYFVQHHCPSPPAPAIPDGLASSEPAPTSRRRLNPRFVEWLMGFPVTWTEP